MTKIANYPAAVAFAAFFLAAMLAALATMVAAIPVAMVEPFAGLAMATGGAACVALAVYGFTRASYRASWHRI